MFALRLAPHQMCAQRDHPPVAILGRHKHGGRSRNFTPRVLPHFFNRCSVSSRQSRIAPKAREIFGNRVGSPSTQPGGLLWLWEHFGCHAVVQPATESCEERDSPGIRPCGVTPAWPLSCGGRGRLEGTKRPLIAQYAGHTGGRPICATAATLGLFWPSAMEVAY